MMSTETNNHEISSKVRTIIAGIAEIADPAGITGTGDIYRDLGVKSTAALDLLLSLEEEFDVSIADEQFGDARTVDSLVELIGGLQ
jgi:acyl carrier protein